VNAIQRPSGLHDTSSTPSFMVAIVSVSPGDAIGSTCSVVSPDLAPRFEANANERPSGLHAGLLSWSPLVTARGPVDPSAAASQICENVLFFVMSTRLTTNATIEPSGDTAGPLAETMLPMILPAIWACLLKSFSALVMAWTVAPM